ncbi:hypothetical protein Sjap_022341 [Stephania japonica]|uniref:Glycosyltransferase N-terminal domain-containing protein n=1 Tax=Stephania japonica TaxID=461633 RepID=A0AAP0EP56_9MAGN
MDVEGKLHVVMLPWLAMGHLIPFLELSKRLAREGIVVSFVSTPRNIDRVRSRIPENLSTLIHLIRLPLPPVHNLPHSAEATIDLPVEKVHYLKAAFDGLEVPFDDFLQSASPDWIIYDFAPYWLPSLASKYGLPCAYLSLFSATSMAFFGPTAMMLSLPTKWETSTDFTRVPKWIPYPSEVVLRKHEIQRILKAIQENASKVSDGYRLGSAVQGCDAVLIRSCKELESNALRLLETDIYEKPIIPAGLLPPDVEEMEKSMDEEAMAKWAEISEWLDRQKQESVVYVALGTEACLTQEEINELAHGLELSELPFFWVFRKLSGLGGDQDAIDIELPSGFKERTSDRGIVWEGWAPQVNILAHPSVGGFLTHCGWNSIIEALGFGRALILFPYLSEQGLNARMMESLNVGLEIPRDEHEGSFTSNSVAKSLKMVMVEEEGERLRSNAREMKRIFGDRDLHDGYIDNLIKYLKNHTKLKASSDNLERDTKNRDPQIV